MAYALKAVARCVLYLVSCLCLLPQPAACADTLDPTRPPAGFGDQTGKVAARQQATVSCVFLMGKKSYAIIAGQTVRLGDRLDLGAESGVGRVRRIDESGVWLGTAYGLRQLKLLPQVKKIAAGKMEKR